MPKLYEYFGLVIFFYSNEHEPVHVHGAWQGFESRADIYMVEGEVAEIVFGDVAGKRPLPARRLEDFKLLVELKASDIVRRWVEYFVHHRHAKPEIITRKLK